MIPDRTPAAKDRAAHDRPAPAGRADPARSCPSSRSRSSSSRPRPGRGRARLWQTVEQLQPLEPHYVSVTCGAGGNPAEGTRAWVEALRERAGWRPSRI